MSDFERNSLTKLSPLERQEKILQLLAQRERISLNEACERFEVSVATIRRDFEALALKGRVRRVHGGVVTPRQAAPEAPILQRQLAQREEKRRIGQFTAQLVKDGETIVLTGGTTTLEVAKHLRGHRNLTVITNSLPIINTLHDVPQLSLIVLGGMFRYSEMSLIGYITEQSLRGLRANKVIMGIRAIDIEHGLTNDHIPETSTDRAIMQIAREVIIVADHTKCGVVAAAFVAPVTAMHTLVTDTQTPKHFVTALRALNLQVQQV